MTAQPSTELMELGYVPKLGTYLRDIWSRREFAWRVPLADLRTQKLDTALGQVWHLLNPALNIFVYYIIFGLVLEVDRGVEHYISFLAIGVLMFTASTRLLSSAVKAMERDAGLIRTVQFPRAILPISETIEATLAFLPAVPVLLVTLLLDGVEPSPRWLLFPFVVLAMTVMNLGISFVGARAGYSVRDLSELVQHITRLLFYASGVLFLPTRFVESEAGLRAFALNPLHDMLTLARWTLMDMPMTKYELTGAIAWTTILPVLGFLWFVRAEHRYGGGT